MSKRGKLFVVIGPSGAGKTTIVEEFMNENPGLVVTVPSYTTRVPRAGERDGEHYRFITDDDFRQKIKEGFFLEWSDAYGSYYGSSKNEIEDLRANGQSVLIVIDRHGAEQIIRATSDVIVIAIMPPNEMVLRERLHRRGTENTESFEFRIQQSQVELIKEEKNPIAQHIVVNDQKSAAIRDFSRFIKIAISL